MEQHRDFVPCATRTYNPVPAILSMAITAFLLFGLGVIAGMIIG